MLSSAGKVVCWFSCLVAVAAGSFAATPAAGDTCSKGKFGCFIDLPHTEWLDDGRKMQLLRPFTYIDPRNRRWTADSGHVVDGASIPSVAWSIVGGPYEGKYRNASIVHDFECDKELRPWKQVHRMFYEATRAGGMGWVKASLMYAAVYRFGPRWAGDQPSNAKFEEKEEYLIRLLTVLRDSSPEQMPLEKLEGLTLGALQVSQEDLDEVRQLVDMRRQGRIFTDGVPEGMLAAAPPQIIEDLLFPPKPGD